ncbi:hypothetical protein V1511DRAFT_487007 [Dipodascopsis uninucleata]
MSKYWCKPCKTFVLDTKLGKSQHEASGRHKYSMERTLRDMHRQKMQSKRDDREAKRVLEEIERAVSGTTSTASKKSAAPSSSSFVSPNTDYRPQVQRPSIDTNARKNAYSHDVSARASGNGKGGYSNYRQQNKTYSSGSSQVSMQNKISKPSAISKRRA